jgi:uncharacterized membrane protein HdeD (DUF308 family)
MLATIARNWWVVMFRGACAVIFGVMTIAWPAATLWVLIMLFGAYAIVDAMIALAMGFRGKMDGRIWWGMVFVGLLGLAAGVTTFAWPGLTALALLIVISTWAILRGILEIAAAITLRKVIDDEWVLALSGLLSLAFGILMLLHPGAGALAVLLLIGATMIGGGIMAIALALRLRRMHLAQGGIGSPGPVKISAA